MSLKDASSPEVKDRLAVSLSEVLPVPSPLSSFFFSRDHILAIILECLSCLLQARKGVAEAERYAIEARKTLGHINSTVTKSVVKKGHRNTPPFFV